MTYSLPTQSPQLKGLQELLWDCDYTYTSHPQDDRLRIAEANAEVAYYSKLTYEKRLQEQRKNISFDRGTARNASLLAREYAKHRGIELPPEDINELQSYVNYHGDLARRNLEVATRDEMPGETEHSLAHLVEECDIALEDFPSNPIAQRAVNFATSAQIYLRTVKQLDERILNGEIEQPYFNTLKTLDPYNLARDLAVEGGMDKEIFDRGAERFHQGLAYILALRARDSLKQIQSQQKTAQS